MVEILEDRRLLASDLGDAPLPYPTTLAEAGAEHVVNAGDPRLGATVGTEADGVHSVAADGDSGDDGVVFGTLRVGGLDATLTVNVQAAAGKLDAWIDFNGDGNWGGPGEQIFDSADVVVGDNLLTFDVPPYAVAGTTYARFRISAGGGLGVGGQAADGEVEDYQVTITGPARARAVFSGRDVSTSAAGATSAVGADIDGDGDLDIVASSRADNTIAWYENDGTPSDGGWSKHTISASADYAYSTAVADVDGDGDLDVFSASRNNGMVAWHENDGTPADGGWTTHSIVANAFPETVFAADVDGDGDIDAVSRGSGGNVAWYENDGTPGDGGWTVHLISVLNGLSDVFAADVDGDGDLDLLSASKYDHTVAWYENDGAQVFTQRLISTADMRATSVFAVDLDRDGHTDVLASASTDNTIYWYRNDGGENFSRNVVSNLAGGPTSVFAADMDGDGDLDLLASARNNSRVDWYENDGSQNFTRRTVASVAASSSVVPGDVDGDGDLDVIYTSISGDLVAWGENPSITLSAAITGSDLVIEDISGLGRDNALTLSRSGSNLVITDASELFSTTVPGAVLSNGDRTLSVPVSALGPGGRIVVLGQGGSDNLTVQVTTDLGFDVEFQGGGGTSDSLAIPAHTVSSVTHTFTSASDGSVTIVDGVTRVISYTGLEPITDDLNATDRVFTFLGGGETITLSDAAGAALTIDSTMSESVTFANPSGSLTINAGGGDDTVTIASVDADGPFGGSLSILGEDGTDMVNFHGDVSLAEGRSLAVMAETVAIGAGVDVVASGGGTVSVVADEVSIDPTSTVQAAETLSIGPQTAARPVRLGNASGGVLNLTDAELQRLTAGTLVLGNSSAGTIHVDTISPAGVSALHLVSGADVVGGSVTAPALAISAVSGISLTQGAATLAASNATSGDIDLLSPNAVTIGIVAGLSGINNPGGAVSVIADQDAIVIRENVSAVGDIVLRATPRAVGSQELTLEAGRSVISSGGAVELQGEDSVTFAAGALVQAATSVLAGVTPFDGSGLFDFSQATITAGTNGTLISDSGFLLGTVNAQETVTITASNGSVVDGNAEATNVTAPAVAFRVPGGIRSIGSTDDPIETAVSNLEANAIGNGWIVIDNTSASLELGGVSDSFSGVFMNLGTISITTTGTLSVTTAGDTVRNNNGGFVNLTAAEMVLGTSVGGAGVNLQATSGGITTVDNAAPNVDTVGTAILVAQTGVGSANLPLGVSANSLQTNTSGGDGNQYLYTPTTVMVAGGDLNAGNGTLFLTEGSFVTGTGGDILSETVVEDGAVLAGPGQLAAVTVQSGGLLRPGGGTALVQVEDLTFEPGGALEVEVDGGVPGTSYDRLEVTGSVALNNATLVVNSSFTAADGDTFVIVSNDGADPVSGIFDGLPEGAEVVFGGNRATISYVGGSDNNDVVLTAFVSTDYGDAPDAAAGNSPGDYNTTLADNGPRHTVVSGLHLGANVDGFREGNVQNAAANGDDVDGALPDDEDGVLSPVVDLRGTIGTVPTVTLLATNTTGSAATLAGWVDYNADGVFDNATERATASVGAGATDERVTLTFPAIPAGSAGSTYARFRLSTDVAFTTAPSSIGAAGDGEVEDYPFQIIDTSDGIVAYSLRISSGENGGPALDANDGFGKALAAVGDFNGDGIPDLVVGARDEDTGGTNRGSIYVLLLNPDGSVQASTQIAHNTGGGPALSNSDFFGHAVAGLGDLNGDGVTDLAVSAVGDDTGGLLRGAVYILLMNADGTAANVTKLASGTAGLPAIDDVDLWGSALANVGDLDGDGVPDLAVGAFGDDTGGSSRGAVHLLYMNSDGTAKGFTTLASGQANGPVLADNDSFGASISQIGDLNGDGVADLAVGAVGDDTGGDNRGAVYVLLMNANRTIQRSTRIASGLNGGPQVLADIDRFGDSIAAAGDLDGDGVPDLVVGTPFDDQAGTGRGAIHVLFMNPDGSVKEFQKITDGVGGGPQLDNNSFFGDSVGVLGDLNGDGIVELAVGAYGRPTSGGSAHVLFLAPTDNMVPSVTSIVRAGVNPTNASSVDFAVTFSESVSGVATGDFVIDQSGLTGAAVTGISGSGTSYTLTVDTGTGDGLLSIDFDADADGGASDLAGNVTTIDFVTGETYLIDKTAPAADIVDVTPDPRSTNAGTVGIVFDEPVTGVDIADFSLQRDGNSVSLAGQTVSGSGAVYSLDLTAVSGADGNYVLTLVAAGSGIQDAAGNPLGTDAGDAWTVNTGGNPPIDSQIIDDGDPAPGFIPSGDLGNPWTNQGFQGDVRELIGPNKSATYAFHGLTPSTVYDLSVTWTAFVNRSTKTPYSIAGAVGGPITVLVDQTQTPDDFSSDGAVWERLGTFTVDSSGTLSVTLAGQNDRKSLIADAVRIDRRTDAEIKVELGGVDLASGHAEADLGVGLLGSTVTRIFTVLNLGAAVLNLAPLTLSPSSDFEVVQSYAPGPSVPPGERVTFVLGLKTESVGSKHDTLTFGTNDADESLFRIALAGEVTPAVVIIDNGDPTGYSDTGNPTLWSQQGYIGSNGIADVQEAVSGGTPQSATYTFTGLPAGMYRVSATWTPHFNRASNAPYRINGGEAILVNQKLSPGNALSTPAGTVLQDAGSGHYFADLDSSFAFAGGTLTVVVSDDQANGNVIIDAVRVERLLPLQVDTDDLGELPKVGLQPPAGRLEDRDVERAVATAIGYWTAEHPEAGAALAHVRVIVKDLPPNVLGLGSLNTPVIWLDDDAAGFGWMPSVGFGPASPGIDLLSVVAHELGHVLGHADLDSLDHPHEVMSGRLRPGVSRVPGWELRLPLADDPLREGAPHGDQVDWWNAEEGQQVPGYGGGGSRPSALAADAWAGIPLIDAPNQGRSGANPLSAEREFLGWRRWDEDQLAALDECFTEMDTLAG